MKKFARRGSAPLLRRPSETVYSTSAPTRTHNFSIVPITIAGDGDEDSMMSLRSAEK